VPIYEYGCSCGVRFERLVPRPDTPPPPCPACGGVPRRRPSAFALSGRADPGPGPDQAPRTWEQTHHGDRETILHWRRTLEQRAKLEERYPEIARPQAPVLAHEGPYAAAPLRAGEPDLRRSAAEHPPGHGHHQPHPHGHPPPGERR
jgi:putative FmdB family regulatory protein